MLNFCFCSMWDPGGVEIVELFRIIPYLGAWLSIEVPWTLTDAELSQSV